MSGEREGAARAKLELRVSFELSEALRRIRRQRSLGYFEPIEIPEGAGLEEHLRIERGHLFLRGAPS